MCERWFTAFDTLSSCSQLCWCVLSCTTIKLSMGDETGDCLLAEAGLYAHVPIEVLNEYHKIHIESIVSCHTSAYTKNNLTAT